MPTITTPDGTEIYTDWGGGQPIVFSHGWPLSSDDRDNQMLFFLARHGESRASNAALIGAVPPTPSGRSTGTAAIRGPTVIPASATSASDRMFPSHASEPAA